MRIALAIATLALTPQLAAQQAFPEQVFQQASELLPWCEAEARAYFVGQGITTYQWTGRYYDQGNMLFAEGKIRANGNDVPVACRVARGGRERYAVVEVKDSP